MWSTLSLMSISVFIADDDVLDKAVQVLSSNPRVASLCSWPWKGEKQIKINSMCGDARCVVKDGWMSG